MGPDIGSNTQNLYFTMSFYILKQKILQKFCKYRFYEYLCIRKRKILTRNVAQLVVKDNKPRWRNR